MTTIGKRENKKLMDRAHELTALRHGNEPTIDRLRSEGVITKSGRYHGFLTWLYNVGSGVTTIAATAIGAIAPLLLMIGFWVLEYDRLQAGATALGQAEASALIAFVFATSNAVLPIYKLSQVNRQGHNRVRRRTMASIARDMWQRVTGDETEAELNLYHNGALHMADSVVLWATLFLAFFAIAGPMAAGETTVTGGMQWVLFFGATLLSVGGVFFLRVAAHEVGCKMLQNQASDPTVTVAEYRDAWRANRTAIYDELLDQYRLDLAAQGTEDETARPFLSPVTEHQAEILTAPRGNRRNGH